VAAAGAAGYYAGGKMYENLSDETQNEIGELIARIVAHQIGVKEAQEEALASDNNPLAFLEAAGLVA
jgi:hypothetical protein